MWTWQDFRRFSLHSQSESMVAVVANKWIIILSFAWRCFERRSGLVTLSAFKDTKEVNA